MFRCRRAIASLICLAYFASNALAQFTLVDGVQIQRTISGPAWTADKLTGKVVLIVLWGPTNPPSMKAMARAARLDQELSPYGLVVLGPNLQKADDAVVEAKARMMGVKFSVTDNIGIKGLNQVNLPMSILFGPAGKSVFDGSSDKAEVRARMVLGAAICDRAKPMITGKSVDKSIDTLRKGGSPATVLTSLIAKKGDSDAKALIDSICFAAKEQLEEAKERLETDPVGVYNDAKGLSSTFKGTTVGAQASEFYAKLKNNKLVQQEIAAHPSLEKVQKLDDYLEKVMKADPSKSDPSSPEFTKAHTAQIGQIRTIAMQMRASWPKTRATSEASDIAMKYGVMFK